MPDGSWKQSDVLCPFYKDDNAKMRSISCEGVFHRTLIVSKFRRQEAVLRGLLQKLRNLSRRDGGEVSG